jgi:hypothetical protein
MTWTTLKYWVPIGRLSINMTFFCSGDMSLLIFCGSRGIHYIWTHSSIYFPLLVNVSYTLGMNYWKVFLKVKSYAPVNFLWKQGVFMIYGSILPFYTQLVIVSYTLGMNHWKILLNVKSYAPVNFLWKRGTSMTYGHILSLCLNFFHLLAQMPI